MPQTFQVLRCYKCEVFQVHPTKKCSKWKCKLCDEKQSIKRFYGLGTGKECRLHVQTLNGLRGELHNTQDGSENSDPGNISESSECSGQDEIPPCSIAKKSKWLDYVDTQTEEITKTEEEHVSPPKIMQLNNKEVVLELPKKRIPKCLTATNKIVKPQPVNLSNKDENTHFIKSMKNSANVKTCRSKPPNNVPAPKTDNNSKWAKFVDGTQNYNDANDMAPITYTNNQSDPMFPFQEDDDIDSVLDF